MVFQYDEIFLLNSSLVRVLQKEPLFNERRFSEVATRQICPRDNAGPIVG